MCIGPLSRLLWSRLGRLFNSKFSHKVRERPAKLCLAWHAASKRAIQSYKCVESIPSTGKIGTADDIRLGHQPEACTRIHLPVLEIKLLPYGFWTSSAQKELALNTSSPHWYGLVVVVSFLPVEAQTPKATYRSTPANVHFRRSLPPSALQYRCCRRTASSP